MPRKKSKRLSLSQKIDFSNLFVGLLFGIISTLIAIWAIRSNEKIAIQSGALEKADLQISIAGISSQERIYDIVVGIPFDNPSITIFELPFEVANFGKRSIEDLYVIFRYHQLQGLLVDSDIVDILSYLGPINRTVTKLKPYEIVTYNFPRINPAVKMNLHEPIIIRETQLSDTAIVTTKDDSTLSIAYKLDYALQFQVNVTAKDIVGHDYDLSIWGINSTSMDDLIQKAIEYLERNCVPMRPRSFLYKIFKPAPVLNMQSKLLVFPHRDVLADSEGVIIYKASCDKNDVMILEYPKDGDFAIFTKPDGTKKIINLNCKGQLSSAANRKEDN